MQGSTPIKNSRKVAPLDAPTKRKKTYYWQAELQDSCDTLINCMGRQSIRVHSFVLLRHCRVMREGWIHDKKHDENEHVIELKLPYNVHVVKTFFDLAYADTIKVKPSLVPALYQLSFQYEAFKILDIVKTHVESWVDDLQTESDGRMTVPSLQELLEFKSWCGLVHESEPGAIIESIIVRRMRLVDELDFACLSWGELDHLLKLYFNYSQSDNKVIQEEFDRLERVMVDNTWGPSTGQTDERLLQC